MKRLLTVLMLLSITIIVIAQDYELYKCTRIGVRSMNNYGNWSEWTNQDCDFIIRLCVKEDRIEFNTRDNKVFYFNQKLKEIKDTDNEGDKYTAITWSGYDQDGLRCNLLSIDYTELRNRIFCITYNDTEVSFSCFIITNQSL